MEHPQDVLARRVEQQVERLEPVRREVLALVDHDGVVPLVGQQAHGRLERVRQRRVPRALLSALIESSVVGRLAQMTSPDLVRMLGQAALAPPNERIGFRDPIADFGVDAIHAVQPWLADRTLCRLAVRIIWKVGETGHSPAAITVLREALEDPTVAVDRTILLFHLGKLGYRVATPSVTPRSRGVSSIPERAGKGWPGFQPLEFTTTDGTRWRSRDGEAALTPCCYDHSDTCILAFKSWSIYHSAEVHVALKDRYTVADDWAQGWRASKLVVYAHGPSAERPDFAAQVAVGWYIEQGDGTAYGGQVDDRWDWPYLVRATDDPAFQDRLTTVMGRHGLSIGDYGGGNRFGEGYAQVGFIGRVEDGRLVIRAGGDQGPVVARGADELGRLLRGLPTDTWHDLHIWRSWPASQAIAAGGAFAHDSMLPVLERSGAAVSQDGPRTEAHR